MLQFNFEKMELVYISTWPGDQSEYKNFACGEIVSPNQALLTQTSSLNFENVKVSRLSFQIDIDEMLQNVNFSHISENPAE